MGVGIQTQVQREEQPAFLNTQTFLQLLNLWMVGYQVRTLTPHCQQTHECVLKMEMPKLVTPDLP